MGEVEMPEITQAVDDQVEERDTHFDPSIFQRRKIYGWARSIAYIVLVLVGETSSTLLGELYFNGGGNNILLVAILETIGFPIFIPIILIYFSSRSISTIQVKSNKRTMAAIYIFLGLLHAACNILYAIGLKKLPVSTFSVISTIQLGFNALFAFFLNSERFTILTLNAVFLLVISSALLIFQPDHSSKSDLAGKVRTRNFVVGFMCTLVGSALHALILSLTQLVFNKIIKRETFGSILKMTIFESLIATCAVLVPLCGGWASVVREMENFHHGRVMYLGVVVAIAVACQLQAIGSVGLILEISSLFSNVVATVALPIIPILGALFFHENMGGIKVISIVLAFWGFISYLYQHYFNDREIVSTQIGPCVRPAQEPSQADVPLSSRF